ncbi:anaerobic C4-dicarboxylate transporter, partial [Escherichia coli]|nr:anaerobic C4-dicarboxylate transporter [Escherichia coli]
GTGHAVYSIMPIIGDVALKNGIRPERPMAAASVASQIAITASPISAAVVYYLAQLSDIQHEITLLSILLVTVPATLFGTLLMSLYSLKRGKEL